MGRGEEGSREGEREIVEIGGGKCTLVKVVIHCMTVTQSRATLWREEGTVV